MSGLSQIAQVNSSHSASLSFNCSVQLSMKNILRDCQRVIILFNCANEVFQSSKIRFFL
jgi:hypothetical protein